MTKIEEAIVTVTGWKPERAYKDRQDYLAALTRAGWNVEDDVFATYDESVTAWLNEAVPAVREKREIPELPDLPKVVDTGEWKPNAATLAAIADAEAGKLVEFDPTELTSWPETKLDSDDAPEWAQEQFENAELRRGDKVIRKGNSPLNLGDTHMIEVTDRWIEEVKHVPLPKPKRRTSWWNKWNGKFNRYGTAQGTHSDLAIQMFEKGATMRAIANATGNLQYALLKRLAKRGHLVTTDTDDEGYKRYTLIHADDIDAKTKQG